MENEMSNASPEPTMETNKGSKGGMVGTIIVIIIIVIGGLYLLFNKAEAPTDPDVTMEDDSALIEDNDVTMEDGSAIFDNGSEDTTETSEETVQ